MPQRRELRRMTECPEGRGPLVIVELSAKPRQAAKVRGELRIVMWTCARSCCHVRPQRICMTLSPWRS